MKQTLATILGWVVTGWKPTVQQVKDWMNSYWHKDDAIPIANVDGLADTLNALPSASSIQALAATVGTKADLVDGKVPAAQLPSYVDDVLEYASTGTFPATGETGKIYVAIDTGKIYRWGGSVYVEISPTPALAAVATSGAYGDLTGRPALAVVATSGAYGDLTGRPAIIVEDAWQNLAVTSNWTGASFQVKKIGNIVYIRSTGFLTNTTGATGVFVTLPIGYRPSNYINFHQTNNGSNPCLFQISPNGTIYSFNSTINSAITFNYYFFIN